MDEEGRYMIQSVGKSLRGLLRDSALVGLVVVTLSLLASLFLGRMELTHALVGIAVALFFMALLLNYSMLLEIKGEVKGIRIASTNEEVSKEIEIISMADFISQESGLQSGDSVLLFSNTLEYDRKHFVDTISNNLNRGVKYYYLMGGPETKRDWHLLLEDLKEKGAKQFPEGKFNTPDIAPLLWTTAIYEFKNPSKEIQAISILEHIYDSNACIKLSPAIARRMKEHFWKFWEKLEDLPKT
jgi:hypothetical protein